MNQIAKFSMLAVVVLTLGACGGKSEDKKSASQVAAKVNSGEISVHQINFQLQRFGNVPQDKLDEAKGRILDGLVEQELAVQQAIEAKLDRNPNVLQAIEASRRDILARAYMDQLATGIAKPTAEEVRKYFVEHPDLFSARKIYRIEEISFPATAPALAFAREQLDKVKSTNDLVAAFKSANIEVGGGVAVKPAEQIPLEILPALAQQKEGQRRLYESGSRASIITVVGVRPEPLTEAQAAASIELFLSNQKKADLARDSMKQLRDKAKIEYLGDFGKEAEVARKQREEEAAKKTKELAEARNQAREVQAAEDAKKAEEARKAREALETDRTKASGGANVPVPNDKAMSKGLSGLK